MPDEVPTQPPPPPGPEPGTSGKIHIDRFTFQRGCSHRLHSVDRRHHFLYPRKARQLSCAFTRCNRSSLVARGFSSTLCRRSCMRCSGRFPVLVASWYFSGQSSLRWLHLRVPGHLIITIVKAFTGVRWDIPYIGPIARRQVEGGA